MTTMSPSNTLTLGQAGKFFDLQIAALRKSGLPVPATQYVLENQGSEIAGEFVSLVRKRVDAHLVRLAAIAAPPPKLRRQPFDPTLSLGMGWEIVEKVGQRVGETLNPANISRKDYLHKGETSKSTISGEERLRRIQVAPTDIQLDASDFWALYTEKGQTSLRWLYDTKGIVELSFWGTILKHRGECCILCLFRNVPSWNYCYLFLAFGYWNTTYPSAVLED